MDILLEGRPKELGKAFRVRLNPVWEAEVVSLVLDYWGAKQEGLAFLFIAPGMKPLVSSGVRKGGRLTLSWYPHGVFFRQLLAALEKEEGWEPSALFHESTAPTLPSTRRFINTALSKEVNGFGDIRNLRTLMLLGALAPKENGEEEEEEEENMEEESSN